MKSKSESMEGRERERDDGPGRVLQAFYKSVRQSLLTL